MEVPLRRRREIVTNASLFFQSFNPLNYAFKPVINGISLSLQEKE